MEGRLAMLEAGSSDLAALRAGDGDEAESLTAEARGLLQSEQSVVQDLEELRAGDLSNRDLAIVAIVIGVIVLLILIF